MIPVQKVSLSNSVKLMTVITFAIITVAGIILPLYTLISSPPDAKGSISMGTLLVCIIGTIIAIFAYAPRSISLSDEALILQRGMGKVSLRYADMASISLYRSLKPTVNIRKFGIGGVFGFVGWYYNKEIGNYISYVGDYSQAFLIQMKSGKKYLLSCDNAPDIVAAVSDRI